MPGIREAVHDPSNPFKPLASGELKETLDLPIDTIFYQPFNYTIQETSVSGSKLHDGKHSCFDFLQRNESPLSHSTFRHMIPLDPWNRFKCYRRAA